VRRDMVADVYWFFSVSATKLSDVRDGSIVEGPKRVFIECFDALFDADFNAIGEKIVLAQKILLLNLGVQLRIVLFSYGHNKKGLIAGPLRVPLRQKPNVFRCVPNALFSDSRRRWSVSIRKANSLFLQFLFRDWAISSRIE